MSHAKINSMKTLFNKTDSVVREALGYILFPVVILVLFVFPAKGQNTAIQLPKAEQPVTPVNITAKQAYQMWEASPGKVNILDVRTPEEYIYVGHAPMAWNIPASLQTYNWDSAMQQFSMKPNPGFMGQVKQVFKTSDTILVMCKAGGRSAMAANQMAAAGFKNVYNITDGMEGDMMTNPNSPLNGQRVINGWKNSGIPWTYTIDRKLMILPGGK
jgi:rhodanese-related sulfurtransferase